MKRLLELAKLINDKELREKTIELLKNTRISNKYFKKYKEKGIKIDKAFGGPSNFHHAYSGGLVEHTYAVTTFCIELAKNLEKVYNIKINMDYLISAALLHDIMKIFYFKRVGKNIISADVMLDHGIWACCELYLRDFPEEIIHIIASHFGPSGPNPPQTIEAIILFYADSLDASIDSLLHRKKIIILDSNSVS
ncbi:MAG: HD domain-containing protein [Candidatus Aenigmatarchaeota archaeon]